jgi:RHS repeat-associated protein
MCPGIAVMGGGGDGGDGDGSGSGGKDGSGGGGSGSGQGGAGDGKSADGAPDYARYPECGYASHPVDVVTGRAFTHPITDLSLPGPLPFVFARMYSSKMAERDAGLGFGWAHSLGWQIEVGRREIVVWNEQGIATRFPGIEAGEERIGPWGWLLRRSKEGFWLDADDGVFRFFVPADESGKCFRLDAVEDLNGNRITLRYDDDGQLAEVDDSAGRTIRMRATREGRIASIEVKNAAVRGRWVPFASYAYDAAGNLVSVTDAEGFASEYAYDGEHLLTADADRTGLTFHFVYDRERRCVESWGDYPGQRDPSLADDLPKVLGDRRTRAKGIHHCRFEYMRGGYSEVADSTQVRRFSGNKHGTLDMKDEGGGITTAIYRDDGHILSRTDPIGAVTRFERDARGRLVALTDPLGYTTYVERDGNGLPIVIADAAGGITRIERDACGNALLLGDPMGGVTTWRYDERGLVTGQVSPTGGRTKYTYDKHGNLITATLPNGGIFRFVYDGLGRRLSRTDPTGARTSYVYSERGDLVGVYDAAGGETRYSYDGEGHLTQVVDPKGRVTELLWGGYHKLCERTDANGNVVRLRYNLEGELVEVHNERGEIHHLAYTTSGLLKGETTFDGRKLWYRNDLAGRVVRTENGALELTDLEYDLAGRLVKRSLNDDSVEEYEYDPLGYLIAATGPAGDFLFERDALGRVVREAQVVGGEEHWTEVVYNAAGERTGRTTSLGHSELVKRGPLGERTRTVLDDKDKVEHKTDLLGRETGRMLPGGGWLQSRYDAMGRVAQRRAGGTAAEVWGRTGEPAWLGARPEKLTVDVGYSYDEGGELIEAVDQARGQTRYKYDPIGQLLAMVPEKARTELFRYDPAGNLYEAGEGASERVYGPGNRLLRSGDTEYAWDGDGRLIEKRKRAGAGAREEEEVWRYGWNGAGLLKQVDRPDGLRAEFAYDPFARRVSKRVTKAGETRFDRVPVSATRFVWDGDVLVHEIEEHAQAGGDPVVEERTYCFEDDGFAPVAHRERRVDDVGRESGGWFHYLNDPIGTPERLIGGDGNVACELRRKAWGETEEAPGGSASTRIRFQGQYEDEETGLRYNRFRYYDPEAVRFTSSDPIGLRGGIHGYAYPRNPTGWVDRLGLVRSGTIPANLPSNLTIQPGNFSQSEIDASVFMANRVGPSVPVTLREPTGERACNGGTSDLVVGGKTYDVYTPETSNPGRIIGGILKKNDQATGVVVDLRANTTKSADLGNVQGRLGGAMRAQGKTLNITDVPIMD